MNIGTKHYGIFEVEIMNDFLNKMIGKYAALYKRSPSLRFKFHVVMLIQCVPYIAYFLIKCIALGRLYSNGWLCLWGVIVFTACALKDFRDLENDEPTSPYTMRVGYMIYCAGALINDDFFRFGIGFISFTIYDSMTGFFILIGMFIAAAIEMFKIAMIFLRRRKK